MITSKQRPVKKSFRLIRLTKILAMVFGLSLIWNLSVGLVEIKTAYLRLSEAEETLKAKEERKKTLEARLVEVKGENYIEKVARDKLAMQKPSETVVLLEGVSVILDGQKLPARPSGELEEPIYKRWWRLVD
jgi:cell division protein FtsB